MKNNTFKIFIAITLAVLLISNTVTLNAQVVSGLNDVTKNTVTEINEKEELITKTVKTQKQLEAAIKDSLVDIIVIKPSKSTKFTIPSGTYKKDLVVYQAYTTLINNGIFQSSRIVVTTQFQIDKAVKVRNIDEINIKTTRKNDLTLKKGSDNTELIINAPNSNISNSAKWKNVVIDNMQKSTWTEKAENNDIVITGNTKSVIVDKKATINSLIINQPNIKDSSIKIKADGKIKEITVETITEIILLGKNTNDFVDKVSNKTNEAIVINIGTKKIEVKPEVEVTQTPIEDSEDKMPTHTVEATPQIDSTAPNIPIIPTAPTVPSISTYPTTPSVPTNTVHTHTYTSVVIKAATCTETGIKTYTCKSGDHTYTEVIPKLSHVLGEWEVTKAATYTETGIKVRKCTVGGEVLETQNIPVVSHTHTYKSVVTKAATCTEAGVKTYTCTICNDTYTEVVPATGHTLGEWETTKAPTYTETGIRVKKCTVDGEVLQTETLPVVPHTHTYTSVVTKATTCTEDGVKTYTCTICNDIYTETIPATGHTLGEWETTTPATYTTTGERVKRCTVDGEILDTEIIPVVPHTHNYVGTVTAPATDTSKGIKTYTCNICGDTYTEEIPMLQPETPVEPTIYTVAIDSTDGVTPSSVTGRDRLDLATEVFNKVNDLRSSLGLSTLTWDTTLDDYTQLRAAEVTQKFNHERPNGERGYQMNDAITSENIAVGYETSDAVMQGWIGSPAHYSAMINPNYDTMAVGCFEEQIVDGEGNPIGEYYTGWVQFFHDKEQGIILEN